MGRRPSLLEPRSQGTSCVEGCPQKAQPMQQRPTSHRWSSLPLRQRRVRQTGKLALKCRVQKCGVPVAQTARRCKPNCPRGYRGRLLLMDPELYLGEEQAWALPHSQGVSYIRPGPEDPARSGSRNLFMSSSDGIGIPWVPRRWPPDRRGELCMVQQRRTAAK
jgi:hypothetical protein